MDRWSGRTALVTGCSVGIGAAISRALIRHGINVVGCARRVEKLQEFSKSLEGPGQFLPVQCDVSNEGQVIDMLKQTKDRFNGVDICVNNAGLMFPSTLLDGKVC